MYTSALAILAFSSSVLAVGQAKVVNDCDFDVSVWSVGAAVTGPFRLTKQGSSYAEAFVTDAKTGGKSLKITIPADGLTTGAPQTNFAYSLSGAQVWYDLSDVFGDPFAGKKLVVASVDTSCQSIVWASGTSPGGSQTKTCTSEKDVVLTICAA